MKLNNAFRWGVVAVVATIASGTAQAQANSITWRSSLDSALQEARKTKRPLLVYFSTVWCGPCQIMKRTTFKDANVIRESKRWVMVSIDGDKQPKVATKYKIDGYPTMLILKPNGTIVSRAGGEMSAKAWLNWQKSKYQAAKK